MPAQLNWQEYKENDPNPIVYDRVVNSEQELLHQLRIIRERDAEEVLLTVVDEGGREKDGQLTFQIDPEGRYVYLQYGNDEVGLLQSVGESESPTLYTSSGGFFSHGTGVLSGKLDRVALEFIRNDSKQPDSITWQIA